MNPHHHVIVLFLIHGFKNHLEYIPALLGIDAILHKIHSIVHPHGAGVYIGKHGGGQLEFFFVVITVRILELSLSFALNQNGLPQAHAFVAAKLQEIILQNPSDDVHQ